MKKIAKLGSHEFDLTKVWTVSDLFIREGQRINIVVEPDVAWRCLVSNDGGGKFDCRVTTYHDRNGEQAAELKENAEKQYKIFTDRWRALVEDRG